MISFYLCETVDRSIWFSVRLERLQFGNWSAQYRLRRENYCASNKVLQFANVPGPVVSHQRLHRLRRDDVDSLVHAFGVECREMPHQPRNIFGALSERRNQNRKYFQTIVQIFAKDPLFYLSRQIPMRGGDQAYVNLMCTVASESLEFLLLQNAE